MSDPTPPPAQPTMLGRYELVQMLGQGGMGEVYLARITGAAGFEKPCIVKTILPALLKDPQFLDRFHHEAKVLVHLVHSNIAQVYDMGEANSTYYMALEYVPGVDLSHVIEQARATGTRLPLPFALYVAQKMAEGLGYAHRKTSPDGTPLGIVHRDVSPHNVMVSYEGEVKVIDFGLAKSTARSKHTLPSTVMGKLGYMSPEQVRGENVERATDIYSLGVVVWEMLAGRNLIPNGTMGEMMAAMLTPKVPRLGDLRADVDDALDGVIRKALLADPKDRYPRCEEFARALHEQAMRAGPAMESEEIGNLVKTLCPDAYANQKKLISKLTSLSRKTTRLGSGPFPEQPAPSPAPQTGPIPSGEVDAFAGTLVRSPAPASNSAALPVPSVVPPAKAPSKVVPALLGLVLLGGAAAGGYFYANRPAPAVAEQAAPLPLAAPPAVVAEPTPPTPGPVEPAAPPEQPAAPDASTAIASPEPAAPPARPPRPRRTQAEWVTVKRAVSLFTSQDEPFAKVGSRLGVVVGDELQVVGKAKGTKRKLLGTATVMEVWPAMARLTLDEDAASARGDKFVAVPERPARTAPVPTSTGTAPPAPPVATVTAPPPPAPPATTVASTSPSVKPAALNGRVSVAGVLMLTEFTIFNTEKFGWSDCRAILSGKRNAYLGQVAPGKSAKLGIGSFRENKALEEVAKNQLRVVCKEGRNDFFARY